MITTMKKAATPQDRARTHWEQVLLDVADAFTMGAEERARFSAKPVARLIAALPFLAECERPERTAIEHLGVYVLSVRATRYAFFATPDDDRDPLARLEPIMRFRRGNRPILDRGMALLALNMVSDYGRDQEIDRLMGKYNPVGSGVWDADELAAELRSRIAAVECPQMDEIMNSTEGDDGTDDWWTWE